MSGQKRPADCASSNSGGPPEKRREREGEDGGGSTAAGGSTAVETVIKLGGVSNSVRVSELVSHYICCSPFTKKINKNVWLLSFFRRNKTSKLSKLKTESWERP